MRYSIVPEFNGNISFSFGLQGIRPYQFMQKLVDGVEDIILTSSGQVPSQVFGDHNKTNGLALGENYPACLQFARQIAEQNNWQFFEAPASVSGLSKTEGDLLQVSDYSQRNARRRNLDFSKINRGLICCLPNLQEALTDFPQDAMLREEVDNWTQIVGDLEQDALLLAGATTFCGDARGLILRADENGKYSGVAVNLGLPSNTGMSAGNYPWHKSVRKIVGINKGDVPLALKEIEILTRVGKEFADKLREAGRERPGLYFNHGVGFVAYSDNSCASSGNFDLPLERVMDDVCCVADYVSRAKQIGIEQYNSRLAEEVARRQEMLKK